MEPSSIAWLAFTIIGGGLSLAYFLYNQRKTPLQPEKKAWKRLAKAQKLNFVPESDPNVTVLSGPYREHLLTLRSTRMGDPTYTFISLKPQKEVGDKVNKSALDELATLARSYALGGLLKVESNGAGASYEQWDIPENDLDHLRSIFRILYTLLTLYPQVLHLEEEAIPRLQEIGQSSETFEAICRQMIVDICQRTTQRGKTYGVPLVCKRCFTHFNLLPITLPDQGRITYYGCRLCGQSREFLPLEAEVVAVLNSQENTEWVQDNGQIKVNWLVHRDLFDFDRVEIQQATDEEVERFAVQVGNDTDELRRPRYPEMPCLISAECQLSESAVRILDHIFGKVVQKSLPGASTSASKII